MHCNNSPLNALAAFAIVFTVGAASAVALVKFIEKTRLDESVMRHAD